LLAIRQFVAGGPSVFTAVRFRVGRRCNTGGVTVAYPAGWEEVDGALERTFELPSFPEAIAFVNRVADAAEQANHHPDIAVSYRKVTIRYWTHSENAITDRDVAEAARIGTLAG
jgi:4a-hydroxytetrahydrobiopterin dehydratase